MKTFVLIVCLAIVYANPEKAKAFFKTYDECLKELDLPKTNQLQASAIFCVNEKENMFDENDEIKKEKLMRYIDEILLPGTKEQMHNILWKCFQQGNMKDQLLTIIQCCLEENVMDLLEKPE